MEEHEIQESNEFTQDKSARVISEDEIIRIRKDKVIKYLKTNTNLVAYVVLAIITYIAVKIRTSNLAGLRDITTGTWTLGPDLDPFFFLRLAKYIVEHGSLFVVDTMRYVPNGFNMGGEYALHPYMIAWFHKFAVLFGSESVTHSAVLYPAFMFGLTVIAFFFMTKKIFLDSMSKNNANMIALIASFFLAVIPALLPRTIAGIPEKESAAFLFLFLAFYFFLCAWKSKHKSGRYVYALLSGIATAIMGNIWGGYVFIFITITPAMFFAFLLGKVDKNKFYMYSVWLFSSFILMSFGRHSLKDLVGSTASGPAFIVFLILLVHFFIFSTRLKKYAKIGKLSKIPSHVISLIISVILIVILSSIVFGPSFIFSNLGNVKDILIKPATSRLIQTVAENRQPYLTEWANSFGPMLRGLPVMFWLFFSGSILLFYSMIHPFKKSEKWVLSSAYIILLVSVIFSRHSAGSILNGENLISKFIYVVGFLVFLGTVGFYYYRYYKNDSFDKLKKIDMGLLFVFSFFFISIVAARATVRTIMMLVPPASIIVSYFVVASFNKARKVKGDTNKILAWGLVVLIISLTLFSGYGFYKSVKGQAPGHVPSIYTQQWQKAMGWVRENTPEDAVFGHWWDYGYWLQSIGERATVLDGGNAISYWNHMMGRYALTGTDNQEALDFLYAHKTTHFLIDSTDIGKYGAFSSIGSDVNYDRRSYIPTMMRDPNQIQEKKNSTVFVYTGGIALDEDIIYDNNGTRVFLPAGKAGVGAILVERDDIGRIVDQPHGIFVYQGRQYDLPLRYGFDGEFLDFGSGIESGFYIYPVAAQSGGQLQIDSYGAMLYLSKRTVKSQLVRLYLYKEDNPNFKLVHSEDDFFVAQIKSQNPSFNFDFIQYQGLRGPIRIWEIEYPEDMEVKQKYLSTDYPKEIAIAT